MNRQQAQKFLDAMRFETTKVSVSNDWHQFHCPLAPWRHEYGIDKNPSMGVKVEPNKKSKFNCFACNWVGDAHDLALELHHLCGGNHDMDIKAALAIAENEEDGMGLATSSLNVDDWEDQESTSFTEFPEWFLDAYPKVNVNPQARLYLKKRNVPKTLWELMDLRWDASEDRILFPVRDFDGTLAGLHGRSVLPTTDLKYKMYTYPLKGGDNNPYIWLGEHWVDWDKPVILCESVFDLARILQIYRNAMCALTASVKHKKISRLEDGYMFVHVWDTDKAGLRACNNIRAARKDAKHKEVKLAYGTDPADTDVFELEDLLQQVIEPDELILD